MAISTINMSGIGARALVTLPYTATSDGLVFVRAESVSDSGYAYLYLDIDGVSYNGIRTIFPANGGAMTSMMLLKKGEKLQETYKIKIDNYRVYFTPLG